ncbi:glycosyltransferase [Candidatus Nitrotoga fabula]|uniref:Glycosyltransferase (Modular protein) n=1 Tax=Candidatus Nitrotoga fabula TaxID=2182327 RepID=A0A916FAT9_9PROT|nr:glycosyltransferase [Candidatus Nitrotoga fabula]CAE6727243.1 Glycosyltransferase (Modular protein) [Candidatus Nitrotoga fabula]
MHDTPMNPQPVITRQVQEALIGLGRTEDIKLSPDGRRLAIAGFIRNRILLLEMDRDGTNAQPRLAIRNFLEISSPGLKDPHGLAFLDDQTLLVANRQGGVSALQLPPRSNANRRVELPDLEIFSHNPWLHSPGSIAATGLKGRGYEVLICNNYSHYVSRHILDMNASPALQQNEMLLVSGLDIPDGVSVSGEGRWIAISNHGKHCVFLYENTPELSRDSPPCALLYGATYPHGIRFAMQDRFLVVADAGAPFVHIYERNGDRWAGTYFPAGSFRVMSEEVFRKGRVNPQEGGPKGIEISEDLNLLLTTSDYQPLAFFNLRQVLASRMKVGSPGASVLLNRLKACPCGSRKRYEQCCGRWSTLAVPGTPASFDSIMELAIAAQRTRDFERAEQLYRQALRHKNDDPRALHMLGVVLFSLHRVREASGLIRRAGELTGWQAPGILFNYGLALGTRMLGRDTELRSRLRRDYDRWLTARTCRPDFQPLVSVVMVYSEDAAGIGDSLESVRAQTYRNLELVVVDDASPNDSAEKIRNRLQDFPFPHRRVTPTASREAEAAWNAAIAASCGEFIHPLHPADRFAPERIAQMVEQVARRGFSWGFSRCEDLDAHDQAISPASGSRDYTLSRVEDALSSADTVGSALLDAVNPVIAGGNLFFSRTLHDRLGGFRANQPCLVRDFCLRALYLAEPCLVPARLYRTRLAGKHGAGSQPGQDREKHGKMVADYLVRAMSSSPENEFAPSRATNGYAHLAKALVRGQITLAPDMLTSLEDRLAQQEEALPEPEPVTGNGLNLVGYFRWEFGLAESVRTLAATCHAGGIAANLHDADVMLECRQTNRNLDALLTRSNSQRNTLFFVPPGQLELAWRRYCEQGSLRGRRTISYLFWEIDPIPEKWRPALERIDEIWVASEFIERLARRATGKPVIRIPHAIEVALERPYRRSDFSLPDHPFLFLFNFDFSSYADRKNPWAVIEAFRRAFSVRENQAGLVIKCHNEHLQPEKFALLQEMAGQDSRITILNRLLSRGEMHGLQSVCDAYVSLHRSEGLGLGMAECMALGKPVIGTAYSGNLEFMNDGNSCLVDYTLIPVKPRQYLEYEPGWMWADPDIDHAAEFMARLFADPQYRRRISACAAADMAARYSHQAVGKILRDRLDFLAKGMG